MSRNIKVEELTQRPIESQDIEVVERKGIGHPDSVADGLAEEISRTLCQEYLSRFGRVLHHNTDKIQIVAGRSRPSFGGGEVIQPQYILLTGRATRICQDREIPVDTMAIRTARKHLKKALTNLDLDTHVILDCKIGMGSSDLCDIFDRDDVAIPSANDTSFGVGYAPLSETEQIVYRTEQSLLELRSRFPSIGEDIKVMGLRDGQVINLTVACAMVDRYVDDLDHYVQIKRDIVKELASRARAMTKREVNIQMNVGDDVKSGSVYLTVTGTSAEMGDDGAVGRGNRANGLITPSRPMSLEATSGKNPINHVGKIYNLLANLMAAQIARDVEGIEEVYIKLLSQIGKPVDQPHVASVQVVLKDGYRLSAVQRQAQELADMWLADIPKVQQMIFRGELPTF
ncbi:MAG: S-adenosylmethionine synthase [Methanosaeta sp. PtaB.Bin039]|nr:MAG: S-adenosylmethionine synthase [Methanosaeta sp. PtaB.Bin039]OPY44325.1 MAG: S-adenosylmethionine synthase [Methanosaeta sp. PtaU1.Bin028]HOT06507.1 methionine adenosyltransferase [Methanotrichaceae archaeon]HQF15620.1 methionine adenosyltransferase [Methanotrichaceae archaeon]HQI90356.1 methionine adenosyltransferase [Methanotrichaceae archaeon]